MVETSHEDEFATKRIFNLEMVYFAAFSVVKETACDQIWQEASLVYRTHRTKRIRKKEKEQRRTKKKVKVASLCDHSAL